MSHTTPLQIEGIILKVVDYRDYDQIVKVFTEKFGIIQFIVKKRPSKGRFFQKISPLCIAEFTYNLTKSNLFFCQELHIVDDLSLLRARFDFLECAGRLIQIILTSQEQRQATIAYPLLLFYLKKIVSCQNLKALETSFLLKILKLEGLINVHFECFSCKKNLESLFVLDNEYYCSKHAPIGSLELDEQETLVFTQLIACQTISDLNTIQVPLYLPKKLDLLLKIAFKT